MDSLPIKANFATENVNNLQSRSGKEEKAISARLNTAIIIRAHWSYNVR
jgi:hypothetical protein